MSSNWDDIYCQRIDADGNVLWSSGGVPLSTGISFAREKPQVVADGDQTAGTQLVTWSGIDNSGNPVRSGVYLYRLQAGKDTISRKMILLE